MKFPCPLGVIPFHFVPSYEDVPWPVVHAKRYLEVMLSSDPDIPATFPFLRGKMGAAWSSVLGQYGNLQCAPSVGLLLKVLLACALPTSSYACETWACRSVPSPTVSHSHSDSALLLML